jgi:tRNA threonylcarbamoyl adenosine modification protein YeaZ
MKILALELSSAHGSVAWLDDDGEPFVRVFANDRKHSGLFFENLQLCLQRGGSPDAIVVGLGPGSYAGVRIAIAAAVGLRAATAAKLTGIPSICGIETAAREYCVIGDARRESFFFGRVGEGRMIKGPSLHSGEEMQTKMMDWSGPTYASETLPRFPLATLAYPSALRLAELTRDRIGEIADIQGLEPIYLREPHITVPKTLRPSLSINELGENNSLLG